MAKVLIIEDDESIASIVRKWLTQNGLEVDVAHTGSHGIKMALEQDPDVVVLDLMLPDMDGLEVCRRLRAGGNAGIIIVTARVSVGERVQGLEAGADDYLPKPFAFEEMLARIRAILRRRAPQPDGIITVGDLEIDTNAPLNSQLVNLTF